YVLDHESKLGRVTHVFLAVFFAALFLAAIAASECVRPDSSLVNGEIRNAAAKEGLPMASGTPVALHTP
ncbi:MAG TPA: hypothetical protein VG963_26005, partial [Polyangiaceae bacterium]|nr:hypothetical protein [Polyangiaceae bacterium]